MELLDFSTDQWRYTKNLKKFSLISREIKVVASLYKKNGAASVLYRIFLPGLQNSKPEVKSTRNSDWAILANVFWNN